MASPDLFSMNGMIGSLQQLRFDTMNEEPPAILHSSPRRGVSLCYCEICAGLTDPQEQVMCSRWVFNLMTRTEDAAHFEDMMILIDRRELLNTAYLLTSDSVYFLTIARIKNGSKRLQKFLGKSDDVDNLFVTAILRLFFQIMTDKYAFYVAISGMRIFDQNKKESIYEQVLEYALYLARDQYGCIALNEIITDVDDPYYRNQLLDMVAHNAFSLSNDAYGNFVVQHMLKLYDLRSTHLIAHNLRGHFVDLSFKKYGSYIVESLLKSGELVMETVVMELLECEGERLVRLARSEYGNYVVLNAIKFTRGIVMSSLFCGLVNKLMPFRHLLHRSPGSNIAAMLDSFHSRQLKSMPH